MVVQMVKMIMNINNNRERVPNEICESRTPSPTPNPTNAPTEKQVNHQQINQHHQHIYIVI